MKIELYDTTLRDGAQSPGISFTAEDKLRIIAALDELGIPYIEAGNPGSNPKDMELFEKAAKLNLKNSRLCAFVSTCHAGMCAKEDEALKKTLAAKTDIVTVFGKSWLLHVEKIIQTSAEENLRMIFDSIKFLKDSDKTVFFDAEHFFDGYADNAEYAQKVLWTAKEAGAARIILCDTNGGTMPDKIARATKVAVESLQIPIGIHCHDDTGLAVAGTLAAVLGGASQVQGTINGIGERCGNTNLCVAIPNLQLKLGLNCLPEKKLCELGSFARYVADISNIAFDENMPYVGGHAFTHKAGMHIDAVNKAPESFEHISPDLVGNARSTLVSEVAGRAALKNKMCRLAPDITKDSPELKSALELVKSYENEGYQYENAEGSLELILLDSLKRRKKFFTIETFKLVLSEPDAKSPKPSASIKVNVDGMEEITAAEGNGPVDALDRTLRKALTMFYPRLKDMKLIDFKVRVLNSNAATAAKVRVLIESSANGHVWRTVGVSTDIIEASWKALLDSVEYKLSLDDGLV
ncbi:MAG: citramalate synthase [Oscillospiraceae bacterium]|nr:citramalate synthase [Oscillospiraceae bacterium]MCL2160016.1 citramalate synthase [Oscillospiraceae bacterium]